MKAQIGYKVVTVFPDLSLRSYNVNPLCNNERKDEIFKYFSLVYTPGVWTRPTLKRTYLFLCADLESAKNLSDRVFFAVEIWRVSAQNMRPHTPVMFNDCFTYYDMERMLKHPRRQKLDKTTIASRNWCTATAIKLLEKVT